MIWPIIIELLLTGMLANASQAILNAFSSDAVAVVSSGSQIVVFVLNIYCIISAGMTILLAPLAGAKRYDECKKVINVAMTVNIILGILISLIGILLVPAMIRLLNIPEELHQMAKQYLLVSIGFSFLQSVMITLSAVFRSLGEMKKVLWVMLSVNLISLIITKLIYVFVPRTSQSLLLYSLVGCIAQTAGIIYFIIMLYHHKEINYRYSAKGLFDTIRRVLPRILHYGIPAGCESLVYLISQTIVVSFIGLLGTNALITKAFAGNIYYYMTITTASTAAGVSIMVGHLIGTGKTNKISGITWKTITLDLIVTALVCIILLLIGPRFLRIYTQDTVIISAAMKVIFCNMILELIKCVTSNLISVLKAIGDVRFPFIMVILGSIINIVISYYCGVIWGLGLEGIWLGYIADILFRGAFCWVHFYRSMKKNSKRSIYINNF